MGRAGRGTASGPAEVDVDGRWEGERVPSDVKSEGALPVPRASSTGMTGIARRSGWDGEGANWGGMS